MHQLIGHYKRSSTLCTENKLSCRPSLKHWAKLRTYSLAVGIFLVLKKNILMYGMNHREFSTNASKSSESQKRFMFKPESRFLKFWYALTFILLIYTAIIVPAEFAFPHLFNGIWLAVETLIDFLFFFDVIVTLNTSFNGARGVLITNRKVIFNKYLKTWMIIDCLSCIPLQLLQESQSANKYLRFIHLNRIYRLLSLIKFLRFTKVSYRTHKMLLIRELSQLSFNLVTFLLVTSILIHNLTCLWIMVSSLEDTSAENWPVRYDNSDQTTLEIYFSSLYFIFSTLTTVGYGDIVPLTNEEKVFTVLVMAFGIAFYSILIGKINSILSSLDNQQVIIKSKLSYFNEFAQAISLSEELQAKVKNHIFLNANKHFYAVDELEFMKNISLSLKEAVSHHLYTTLVNNITFFRKRKMDFLKAIIPKLKKSQFVFKEVIYYLGDPTEEIYFLNKGRVNFNLETIHFRTYHQGSYFGEIELIEGTNRENTTIAGTKEIEVFILLKKDFELIPENFPEVYSEIIHYAKSRKEKNKQSLQQISNLMNQDSFEDDCSSNLSSLLKTSNDQEKQKLLRRDTAVMISVKNDNEDKKRNRALWSSAVEGNPKGMIYKRARTMKATMIYLDENKDIQVPRVESVRFFRFKQPAPIDTNKKKLDSNWIYNKNYLNSIISTYEKDLITPTGEFCDKYLRIEKELENIRDVVFLINKNSKLLQDKLNK